MDELFGVPMSVGTLGQLEQITAERLAESVEEARAHVPEPPVAHLDEMSWRRSGKWACLWVAVATLYITYV